MAYENVLVERGEDLVGVVTLNKPARMNAFTSGMSQDLSDALQELEDDPAVRVVLLNAAGKAFCVGIDVKEMTGKGGHELKAWVEHMEKPLFTMSRMAKPVIAQIQGTAAANGAGLAAAADLCIASSKARFGFTAVNVGLFCLGPAVPLARLMGRKKALELLLYGSLITADQALEYGLVNRLAEPDALEDEARAWAADLAQRSPVAVQVGKKAFYAMEDMGYHQAFDYMNEAFARLCTTRDAKEGVGAFLGKRKPEWKGR